MDGNALDGGRSNHGSNICIGARNGGYGWFLLYADGTRLYGWICGYCISFGANILPQQFGIDIRISQ